MSNSLNIISIYFPSNDINIQLMIKINGHAKRNWNITGAL